MLQVTLRRSACFGVLAAAFAAACSQPVASLRSDTSASQASVATVDVLPGDTIVGVILSGAPLHLRAVLRDVHGDTVRGRVVTWTSSDTSRLKVDASGLATAVAPGAGPVTVWATCEGVSAAALVRVVVYHNDFEQEPTGELTSADVAAAWNDPDAGVLPGRVHVVDDAVAAEGGHLLRVSYAPGVGISAGGAIWTMPLGRTYQELYVSYRVKFAPGFDFVLGSKLPGLAGGAANTGGIKPNGRDGWSGRMMWEKNGRLVQYVYHPDQPGAYGESVPYKQDKRPFMAVSDRWYYVTHHIVMNTPGQHDGLAQAWVDGRLVLSRHDFRFRDVDSFGIDAFQFSTFFGGNTPEFAATKNEQVYFDDFLISTTEPGM
jgi:hypothetical protein